MTASRPEVARQFSELVSRLPGDIDEAGLERAYEAGRVALEERLGLLEVVDLFQGALGETLAQRLPEGRALARGAAELLSAALAPYEMTHRGYRDSVARLQAVNRDLRAANEELEAFSYSASHDLKAPLRGIDAFCQILQERYSAALDAEGREMLHRVRAAAGRLDRLIEGLLTLAKLGGRELRRESVDLSGLARGIAEELSRAAPRRRVEFACEDGLRAEGDPSLLRAVLTNLLSNAWKFTSKVEGARVEFGSRREPERAFFVKDNGAGFDMEAASRLFGAFQRLHSHEDFEGSGIGLATVRRIVTRHGGRIWAESRPGHGATFFFTLGGDHGTTAARPAPGR